jgi:amino acid adenylation domain-containing protein
MKTAGRARATSRLSPMQEGMLFHSMWAPDAGAYVGQVICTLDADLDRDRFERAWRFVVDRHPVLRSSFEWRAVPHAIQRVHADAVCPLRYADWRGADAAVHERWIEGDRTEPFDVGAAPLMRMALHRRDEDHLFVWTHHHILLDGRSRVIVLREVGEVYEAYLDGREPDLPAAGNYHDYIDWLWNQPSCGAEAYWRSRLGTVTTPVTLAVAASADEEGYGTRRIDVSPALARRLAAVAYARKTTVNTIVQCAWAVLLGRYAGQSDVVFGATRSCRRSTFHAAASVVGVLINTLPHRLRVDGERRFSALIDDLREQQVAARQYQHTPLAQIRAWSGLPAGAPLFDTLVVFEERELSDALRAGDSRLWRKGIRRTVHTHYGLTIAGYAKPSLAFEIGFDRHLFSDGVVTRMGAHLVRLLEQATDDPDVRCGELDLLTQMERRQIVEHWTATRAVTVQPPTLAALVEAQAARTPDAIAVIGEHASLSYRALNLRANRVARRLMRDGAGPEAVVGIAMPRSVDFIVALLGVLKAGAAFLPLDPEYPPERLAFMLEDARCERVVIAGGIQLDTRDHVRRCVLDDSAEAAAIDCESPDNPCDAERSQPLRPLNAAYIIYTSGSTGTPKAVVVAHRTIVNKVSTLADHLGLCDRTRFAVMSAITFDPLFDQVFCPLAAGGACVVVPDDVRTDARQFAEYVRAHGINVVNGTPGLVDRLFGERLPRLDTLVVGADVLPAKLANELHARQVADRILNFYGPTETCINAAGYDVSAAHAGAVPIGRALPTYRLYVLSPDGQPVPVGVAGELCIGGRGVSRGYLRQPALTAERFVPDPFGPAGDRMYRTGDRVRWRADGNLEFLGRTDRQVKIRGFRVEPREIESALEQHPAIAYSAVLTSETPAGHKTLIAYIVPHPGGRIDGAAVPAFLKRTLPPHMIPAHVVVVDRLPLTPNGKVDIHALPPPTPFAEPANAAPAVPETAVEQAVAAIWTEVLGRGAVRAHDDFFELGGDSLSAMQVVARLRDRLRVEAPLRLVFGVSRLDAFAAAVDQLPVAP